MQVGINSVTMLKDKKRTTQMIIIMTNITTSMIMQMIMTNVVMIAKTRSKMNDSERQYRAK